ncbi:MAG: hypothetical protein H7Y88_08740 [Phycisphaerales bacterium]|nr:hypothetical protein [Phycisphaerales bacterium]
MRRDTVIQLSAAGVLALCLAASIALTSAVSASAGRHKLTYTDTAEAGTPPVVAIGVAMGAFRGIFVNYLWIRANTLKEEGKFYEAVDLASTITKLQPRFPRVWAFHAWNLSYNISVATHTPEERWQWVQAGIRLLRDQGIPANPSDLLIHKELCWIFLHKVQGISDDANNFYKREIAREWTIVLGPPPRRENILQGRGEMKERYTTWLRRVADAPDSLEQVYTIEPAAQMLVTRLRDEVGWDLTGPLYNATNTGPAEQLLTMVEELRSIGRAEQALKVSGARPPGLSEAAVKLLADETIPRPAWIQLSFHLRKRLLVDKYKMEPERMIRFTEKYGPLDWRHPASHALYWGARGVEEALLRVTEKTKRDFDFTNTDRLVIHAIQELYRSGEVTFDILNPGFFIQMPNPDYIDAYTEVVTEIALREGWANDHRWNPKRRIYTLYGAGAENFLRDVIRFLYRRGDKAGAERKLNELRTSDILNTNNPDVLESLNLPLDEFVVYEIRHDDRFTSPEVARSEVVAALQAATISGLLQGNMELFWSQFKYAKEFHKIYTDRQVFETVVTRDSTGRMEVMDRDFRLYAARVIAGFIIGAGIPDGPMMFQRIPAEAEVQPWIYVLLEVQHGQQLEGSEENRANFNMWFPPPSDLDLVRAEIDAMLRQAQDEQQGAVELK